MKTLITGGAGNLACQYTHLLPPDHEILLVDIADTPVAPVREGTRFEQGDLCDREGLFALIDREKPDRVLHLASLLSGSTEMNRTLGWQINATAGFDLLEACHASGVGRVLFPSSLAVWGGDLPDPMPEDQETWPDGLYGVTKVAVERLGHYYHSKHGLDFRAVRLPIIISPYAPQGAASAYASHAFVECAQGRPFRFKVRPDTRVSMMYVKDALGAFSLLLEADPDHLTRRVYNIQAIAPDGEELLQMVKQVLPDSDIDFDPDPEVADLIHSWPGVIRDESARQDWGWSSEWNLESLATDILKEVS